ncbi:DUF927 domain-containing protein [Nevskia sp.]|uniref:DUF927 domain-containing protein n=1 Tax=Nevskia sp. TaxID=1929292 RepID=UPI0025EE3B19|nr:DUF927 domain-containing protein [Nevskia sp.]
MIRDLFDFDPAQSASDGNDEPAIPVEQPLKRARAPRPKKEAVTAVTAVQANDGGTCSDTAAVTSAESAVSKGEPADALSITECDRPCFMVFENWTEIRQSSFKLKPGVWYFSTKPARRGDEAPQMIQRFVCSPLYVDAVTFDGDSNNYGRLLRFEDTVGNWREWAMPMELLRADASDLRGELLSMGVLIDPDGHRLLSRYLQEPPPKRKVRCALQVGWSGSSYVMPNAIIGGDVGAVIFQSGERTHGEHGHSGTMPDWQRGIATPAIDNPILILALTIAFAGPLLAKCNAESGGVHLHGDSSTGKSTAIEAACSVWGGRASVRSWKATANGMEGVAAMCNDNLLALDEISECDPDEVGAIVYAIGNGRGKQRASRSGAPRPIARWRCSVISSGERTIATTLEEGKRKAKAGQGMRLIDLPVTREHGAWDELHGAPTGTAFSDAIKSAAALNYGHAGRAFLEKLTRDDSNFPALYERMKALPEFEAAEGQSKRVGARFALLALSGELATTYGITGWQEGTATAAAATAFRTWKQSRGEGSDERTQALRAVSEFIELHGDSRFSSVGGSDDDIRVKRAGWWLDGELSGRTYLFTTAGLREALKGFDFKRVLTILQTAGALPPSAASGERSQIIRVGKRSTRLYPVLAAKLRDGHGD